jgi:hypothetical protein
MSTASIEELKKTVSRMEERFRRDDREQARQLMTAYQLLVEQFASDLGNERDELLSRAGALMLIQKLLT